MRAALFSRWKPTFKPGLESASRGQDVAAKVLYMSVLCNLSARFRVRKISRSRSQSNSYPPRASATNSFVVLKAPSFLLFWLLFTRAVPSFAPGQDSGLRKNLSGALPLRRWTARIRQRRKAMLSFLSRKDILDRNRSACHQVVADKALSISVLCYLSARFCSRKNQDIIHSQTHSRHDLCVRCFCQQRGGKACAAGK